MAKTKLKYIGRHQPNNVIEVNEDKVKGLLKSGDYILIEGGLGKITSFKEDKVKKKKDGNSK